MKGTKQKEMKHRTRQNVRKKTKQKQRKQVKNKKKNKQRQKVETNKITTTKSVNKQNDHAKQQNCNSYYLFNI